MTSIFQTYNEKRAALKEVAKKRENRFSCGLMATLWAIIIMIGPLIVLGNCFIFNDFIYLILIGFVASIFVIAYLARVFYFLSISQKEVDHLGIFFAVDGMFFLLMMIVASLFMYFS